MVTTKEELVGASDGQIQLLRDATYEYSIARVAGGSFREKDPPDIKCTGCIVVSFYHCIDFSNIVVAKFPLLSTLKTRIRIKRH